MKYRDIKEYEIINVRFIYFWIMKMDIDFIGGKGWVFKVKSFCNVLDYFICNIFFL